MLSVLLTDGVSRHSLQIRVNCCKPAPLNMFQYLESICGTLVLLLLTCSSFLLFLLFCLLSVAAYLCQPNQGIFYQLLWVRDQNKPWNILNRQMTKHLVQDFEWLLLPRTVLTFLQQQSHNKKTEEGKNAFARDSVLISLFWHLLILFCLQEYRTRPS